MTLSTHKEQQRMLLVPLASASKMSGWRDLCVHYICGWLLSVADCTLHLASFDCIVQARAMMLTSMDTNRRRRVLKAMKHEQSAAILVSMNQAGRKSILEDLNANGDMHGTIDVIR